MHHMYSNNLYCTCMCVLPAAGPEPSSERWKQTGLPPCPSAPAPPGWCDLRWRRAPPRCPCSPEYPRRRLWPWYGVWEMDERRTVRGTTPHYRTAPITTGSQFVPKGNHASNMTCVCVWCVPFHEVQPQLPAMWQRHQLQAGGDAHLSFQLRCHSQYPGNLEGHDQAVTQLHSNPPLSLYWLYVCERERQSVLIGCNVLLGCGLFYVWVILQHQKELFITALSAAGY